MFCLVLEKDVLNVLFDVFECFIEEKMFCSFRMSEKYTMFGC